MTIRLSLESEGRVHGRRFSGVEGLQKALLSKDVLLAEAYIEALLSMANGRQSGVADKTIVQDIIKRANTADLPALSILVAVLRSDAFRTH
ncbi:DUF1585 domain-containing protein [Rhodopirellula sp. ICT_H3.1]|uniref:DUF1585 domain-containing protein n=1 Tax=Aporhodopirellula aestuarii TaxID=2950107 RepID=A0ABT0TZY9_9BACT|nr:DUF1585 domain-containing protein [Aporhodopirellula aestuarii]MCM2370131.1 DUF1585 domain-containing protein [Aporhodopirellula aestuarii]